MKRCALLLTLLLFATLFAGCGAIALPKEDPEEPVLSPTEYRIRAELSEREHLLSVETEIDYSSPADDLSAVQFMIYPNAYREGHSVVTEDKVATAYPSAPSYGGAEILSVCCDVPITGRDLSEGDLLLTLSLERPLKRGERLRFKIAETVTLANIKHRLGYYDGYYYLSGFYPVVCPFVDGKYLTYEYTPYGDPFRLENASFTLDLTLPIGMVCASSAEEVRREAQGNNVTLFYRAAAAREIALVASGRLRATTFLHGDTSILYYTADGSDKQRTLDVIEDAMIYYESIYGAYPYPTYSVVVAPFFESGVEHSGMAVISCDLSFSQKKRTILHETAHQWWFGKVGNDEYLSPWIDEGLAEYSVAAYYLAKGYPAVYREIIRDAEDAYSIRLALKGSEGVRFDLPLPDLAEGYYDRVYAGSLLLFSTLSELVGCDAFHAALSDIADSYQGEILSEGALVASLSLSLGKDYSSLFRAWLTGVVPLQ